MIEGRIELRAPLDLGTTLGPLAHGRGDATIRIGRGEAWLAFHTSAGPASLRLVLEAPALVRASAWGAGAERALEGAPALVGEMDRPETFVARHPVLRRLQRTNPGLRLPSSGRVLHSLVPTIIEQKVTGTEAFRAYAALLRAHGEPAPGPMSSLRLPPTPERLAGFTVSRLPSARARTTTV